MTVEPGSVWVSINGKTFIVTDLTETEENTWVFYKDQLRQYSCYLESFLSRFTKLSNGY